MLDREPLLKLDNTWNQAFNYEQYYKLLENLLLEGKTTGTLQSPERLEPAKLNLARMKRLKQRAIPSTIQLNRIKSVSKDLKILFIVEGWCGDAAQIVPVLENLINAGGCDSRYILRDENPKIMEQFLTNGTRSIPVAIALNAKGDVLGNHWGPRPAMLQKLVKEWKINMDKHEWHKELHSWYADNQGEAIQDDFIEWLISR